MANRRWVQSPNRYIEILKTLTLHPITQSITPTSQCSLHSALTPKYMHRIVNSNVVRTQSSVFFRNFCSNNRNDDTDEEFDEEDDESEGEDMESADDEGTALSVEDKEKEATEIGYKVISPLQKSDRVFKPYEPVFAVVQVGSHQFKVSNGDCIYAEKLKYCDVNDKALDAKVIIFKKKRRKNYRRTKGHRQELTKLRITDIVGIGKPETMKTTSSETEKKQKPPTLKAEKTPVTA